MKKILFILFLAVESLTVDAQVNFMGIPVDGTATEMIQKLKNKGFSDTGSTYENEGHKRPTLKGTFNGKDSQVYVLTNKGKAYRVVVFDSNSVDEAQIITDFNNLFDDFYNSHKYLLLEGDKIDRKEDISYEMRIHNKQYDAVFYQIVSDSLDKKNVVWFRIEEDYGKYYIGIRYDNLSNKANGEDL